MANLLEEASILLTPTAYNDGKMLSVKPNENLLGSELVANGDFATDSNWTKDGNWSIANGKATSTGAGRMFQSIPFLETNIGTKVVVSFDIVDYTSGGVVIQCYGSSSETFTGVGTHTFETVTTNTLNLYINNSGQGNLVGSIDNVSVKVDLSGDFIFTRNSAATRVNSQGLVENVQILSSDLVSNGNFSQEGSEEVLNGSFSQEGADLVTNGGFATDSDWVLNDWNISGGLLNASASTGIVFQSNLGLTVGKTYKATLEVSNYVSGAIRFKLGGSSYQNIASTNGIQEFFFIASTTANNILFSVLSAYTGSIDNVSVKEVGQDWTLGSGWSVGDDKVNTIGENQYLIQTNVSGSGVSATLKVQWTQEITSGSRLRFFPRNYNDTGGTVVLYSSVEGTGSYTGGNAYGDGVFTVYVKTTDGYSFKMLSETGNDGSVTGVSVKEVAQDWTLDVGWGIGDNEAVVNNTANADLEQTCMVSGRKYKVSFEISDLLSGGISVGDIVNPGAYAATTNGLHSFIYTATNPTLRVRAWGNPCSITNISVVEITDATNLPRINYEGFSYQDSLGSELVINGDFTADSDWNKGTDWSISNGTALHTGAASYLTQSILEPNKQYKVRIKVLQADGSNFVQIYMGNSPASVLIQDVGEYEYIFTSQSVQTLGFALRGVGYIEVDNVSVKEYLGQEVVPDSGCGSWLLEPQSTNTYNYSEPISSDGAASGITYESFDWGIGFSNCIKFGDNTQLRYRYGGSVQDATEYTISAFVIMDDLSEPVLDTGASNGDFKFVLGGLIGGVANENVYYGNNVYRVSATMTSGSSSGNSGPIKYPSQSSKGFRITGIQIEEGSFPTSYIPTNGAASTRLSDLSGNSGNASLINSTEGVMYAEIRKDANPTTFSLISLNNEASNSDANSVTVGYASGGSNFYLRVKSTGGTFTSQTIPASNNEFHKVAIRYEQANIGVFIDGIKEVTYTGNYLFSQPLDNLSFDYNGNSTLPFYGKNKAVAVFKTALTDEQLIDLTTI